MASPDRPAEWHRQVAGVFTDRVRGTRSWDAPAPVAGWAARDVVRHLTTWLPGLLASGAGLDLPGGPPVDEDPVRAWQMQCDGVQAVLDDPATAHRELTNPHIGRLPLATAIDRFYTADVFLHTWDLARATGQTSGWTPASAPGCSPRWSRWRRRSAPPATTAPGSRSLPARMSRPGCSVSSAGSRSGPRADRLFPGSGRAGPANGGKSPVTSTYSRL